MAKASDAESSRGVRILLFVIHIRTGTDSTRLSACASSTVVEGKKLTKASKTFVAIHSMYSPASRFILGCYRSSQSLFTCGNASSLLYIPFSTTIGLTSSTMSLLNFSGSSTKGSCLDSSNQTTCLEGALRLSINSKLFSAKTT